MTRTQNTPVEVDWRVIGFAMLLIVGVLAWRSIAVAIMLGTPVIAFLWGLYRIAYRSPASSNGYGDWLATTPWKRGMPLPRGPVRLNLIDGTVAGGLCLLSYLAWRLLGRDFEVFGLSPAISVLLGAALALAVACWRGGQRRLAYGTVAVLPLVGLILPPLPAIAIGSILAYLVGLLGNQQTLRHFAKRSKAPPLINPGWPYNALRQEPVEFLLPHKESLTLAAVFGLWGAWISTLLASISPDEADELRGLAIGLVVIINAAIFRLLRYLPVVNFNPRLAERIMNRRPLLKNDAVFLMPILAIGVAMAVGVVTSAAAPGSVALSGGFSMAAGMYLMCGVGPTVRQLHYTGNHELRSLSITSLRSCSNIETTA